MTYAVRPRFLNSVKIKIGSNCGQSLTFRRPYIVIYSYNKGQQDALFSNLVLVYIYLVRQIPIVVNTVLRLLMMDSKFVRNM